MDFITFVSDPKDYEALYNELLISFIILFVTFMFVIVVCLAMLTPMKIKYRKYHEILCKKVLEQKEKITDEKDIEYLEKISPRLEGYSKKWWYNNSPAFLSRKSKINKIIKKYDLEVKVWND